MIFPMTQATDPNQATARPVLVWHPDQDESEVVAGPQQAAELLQATAAEVLAAIQSGNLLNGHFVDWQA
jgi:hypothetical protein